MFQILTPLSQHLLTSRNILLVSSFLIKCKKQIQVDKYRLMVCIVYKAHSYEIYRMDLALVNTRIAYHRGKSSLFSDFA